MLVYEGLRDTFMIAVEEVGAAHIWAALTAPRPCTPPNPYPCLCSQLAWASPMPQSLAPGQGKCARETPFSPGWVMTFSTVRVGSEFCVGLWSFRVIDGGAVAREPRAVHGPQRWFSSRVWWVLAEAPGFGSH